MSGAIGWVIEEADNPVANDALGIRHDPSPRG
jgi:hypothetical protein